MKRIQTIVILTLLCFLCLASVGCLKTFHVLIKPNADGSGTLAYTFVLKEETVRMMKEMDQTPQTDSSSASASGDKSEAMGPEASMRKYAAESDGAIHLDGVDLVIRNGDTLGATGYYSFNDITKININKLFNSQSGMNKMPDDTSAEVWTRFEFEKGISSVLKVHSRNSEKFTNFGGVFSDAPKAKKSKKKKSDTPDVSDISNPFAALFAEMLDSLDLNLSIEPQGRIQSTDAGRRTNNRISFAEVNFSGLKTMMDAREKNPALSKRLEKTIKSKMWMEPKPVVEIRFSN